MNPLFVGIDVGSQNNSVYLMKPDGEKHSSFRMQNNLKNDDVDAFVIADKLRKCSGLALDKDITNASATTIALMERFETADELAYADLDELTAFIDEKGRNFADLTAKAKGHGRKFCVGDFRQSQGFA